MSFRFPWHLPVPHCQTVHLISIRKAASVLIFCYHLTLTRGVLSNSVEKKNHILTLIHLKINSKQWISLFPHFIFNLNWFSWNLKYFFMCLLAICVSSLKNICSYPLPSSHFGCYCCCFVCFCFCFLVHLLDDQHSMNANFQKFSPILLVATWLSLLSHLSVFVGSPMLLGSSLRIIYLGQYPTVFTVPPVIWWLQVLSFDHSSNLSCFSIEHKEEGLFQLG